MPQTSPLLLACRAVLATALLVGSTGPAWANDRPFQSARTATNEDDDVGTWSIETWTQRFGPVLGVSVEPEYRFTAEFSVQVELTRLLDRGAEETGHEAEIEFKYLLSNLARDGYGWGISAAYSGERLASGRGRTATLRVPFTVPLTADNHTLLHLNLGMIKPSDSERQWHKSIALESALSKRAILFAELARDGPQTYGQAGMRYWVKRERLAVDVAVQQRRLDGQAQSGLIIGLGWYDL